MEFENKIAGGKIVWPKVVKYYSPSSKTKSPFPQGFHFSLYHSSQAS